MKSVAVLSLIFTVAFTLSACENAEFIVCKEKASKLWDPKENDSKKQVAYWRAIESCKEQHK